MSDHNPIMYQLTVVAEDSSKYPDMRLRMFIRQAVLSATSTNEIDLDEAIHILNDEADYLKNRIKGAR